MQICAPKSCSLIPLSHPSLSPFRHILMASRLRPLAPALRILPRTSSAAISSASAARRSLSLKSFFTSRKPESKDAAFTSRFEPVLEQADLFHPLSKSPLAPVRTKAEWINAHGSCPVCKEHDHPEHKKSKQPVFECPDCGYPTHCSEEHYKADKEHHKHVCGILREVNEDEHDLRSGRRMKEFEFPGNVASLFCSRSRSPLGPFLPKTRWGLACFFLFRVSYIAPMYLFLTCFLCLNPF